jgi:DNA-binding ferritin-like protein
MLQEIAVQLRFLQLLTHNAHNLISGVTFLADHKFFGKLYPIYEAAYDKIVERAIGTDKEIDLSTVAMNAAEMIEKMEEDNTSEDWFYAILAGEQGLCGMVEKCFKESKKYSQGTLNLLAQTCDDSEARQYKMQQRLK